MTGLFVQRIFASEIVRLLPILALAFYLAFIPHMDSNYPVHVDEWGHLTYTKAVQDAGSIEFTEPFPWPLYSTDIQDPEIGYHVFLGMFQEVTDISWLTFFRYFSGVIFAITVLSVYILARREGFGWPAALATCLIPTSVGILGPAFMVPMSLGLLFIPLCLFLAFNFKTWASYVMLFIFASLLLVIHVPTAIGLVIIFIPYILLNLRANFSHSLKISVAIGTPFLVPLVLMFNSLISELDKLSEQQSTQWFISYPDVLESYGYVPVAIGFLGIVVLAVRNSKRNFSLILGMFALILVLLVFFRFHYGSPIWYNRGILYVLLMLSILTGAGLQWIKTKGLPFRSGGKVRHYLTRNSGALIYASLIVVIIAIAIPNRLNTSYYHMIDDEDYERIVWIRDNLAEDHEMAVLDPWKATALVALADQRVVSRIHSHEAWQAKITTEFLNGICEYEPCPSGKCSNTAFLTSWNASLVYNPSGCDNPDLVEVSDHVYILRDTAQ